MSQSIAGGFRSSSPLPEPPVVSIVTVVFNDKQELEALIENMKSFRSDKVEFVVIDGGSKDGSLDVLHNQNDAIDYWISESDTGIYDAMNKGLKAVRGKWVLHLNAGDRLLALPIELLVSLGDTADLVSCPVDCFAYVFLPNHKDKWTARFENRYHHQGTFYRRQVHFGYDTTYKILADFSANQIMHKKKFRVVACDTTVATHELGGISEDAFMIVEHERCVRENYGLLSALLFKHAYLPYKEWSRQRYRKKLRARAAASQS